MKRLRKKRFIINIFKLGLIGGLIAFGGIFLWVSSFTIPDVGSFEQRKVTQSTKIYDRTGKILLYDVHENIKRTVISSDDISRNIKNATVAIEDAEFYDHKGIKPTAIIRATLVNITSLGFTQGGSTITQQVIKNSLLTREKKISRKLKEWFLSLKLEQELTKEEILERYLNETPYGGNLYGVAEASQAYFGKEASELTLAESAYLAALPQAPTFYSPYGNNVSKLDARKNLVLERMFQNNFITQAEYDTALNEEVNFQPRADVGILAPHFVFYVLEYLESKYGKRAIEEQGFKITTTLDYELQEKAQGIVNEYALRNEERFNAENAGLVAIDPETGQILVMVGSRNYFDEGIDGNFNVTIAQRQPGSAFKPFVYATAFTKGYTPETIVFDARTQFSTTCPVDNLTSEESCYSPGNYDNIFRGPVTFRNALAQSINVPAVKVLYLAGLSDSIRIARDMGISTLTDGGRYGLTLVLGGGEVKLLDITSAYGVFANEGVRLPHTAILSIKDSEDNLIEEFEGKPKQVLPTDVALQISDILSDNVAREPLYGSNSLLYFPANDVAVKTGTTNDYRDAWTVGYTPGLAVGAWAGNNDNSSMEKKISGLIITPLWNAFMQEALKKYSGGSFKTPTLRETNDLQPILRGIWQGGESYFIDSVTGKLATEYTPNEVREERVVRNIHSILYWINKNDPRSEKPENPENDFQFERWEYGVEQWKEENNITDADAQTIPTEVDDVHSPELAPKITITYPFTNNSYASSEAITIRIDRQSRFPLVKVDYFLDGALIGSVTNTPFSFAFIPNDVGVTSGTHILKAVGYDSVSNKGEGQVEFSIE